MSKSFFYEIDGRKYISVTSAISLACGSKKIQSLMRWAAQYPDDYLVRQHNAMKFGNLMHVYIGKELINWLTQGCVDYSFVINGNAFADFVSPEYWPHPPNFCMQAMADFCADHVDFDIVNRQPDFLLIEEMMYSDRLRIAGTFDAILPIKKIGWSIVDWKFTKNPTPYRDYKLQLAFYKEIANENGIEVAGCVNVFPNSKNKTKIYTMSDSSDFVSNRELELIAELAHIRLNNPIDLADDEEGAI
jgi:hypothetical protein